MHHITLSHVCIDFPIYHAGARSLKNQILRGLTTGGRFLRNKHHVLNVRALEDISLHLEHGDRVGLIGPNGAGKSTLLRVLSGIYEPTQGTIEISGKVSSLMDITMGIHPESTGYENIVMQATLLGLTKKQIAQKMQDIAEFSGLGDFLSVPIHTYSAGMRLRLAFSVATSITPEILLLDEVINVGDADFLKKASQRMEDLISQSGIVVLASHSVDILKKLCNKVVVLAAGKLEYFGPIEEGIERFYR